MLFFKKGDKNYESLQITHYRSFAELRIDGFIKLYYRSGSNGSDNLNLHNIPYITKQNSDKYYCVYPGGSRKNLSKYFIDYPDLSVRIKNTS